MNTKIEDLLNLVAKGLVLALIIILPFFFLTLTTEFFETPKFIALVIITLGLILLWSGTVVSSNKLKITKSPVDIPLLLLLIVSVVSTFFSKSPWVSIIGNLPRVHGSLAAIVVYVLLYFVLVATLKHTTKLKEITHFMLLTGLILAVWTLASYFGISLPNFTPTGSSASTVGLLLMFLPFAYVKLFQEGKYQTKIFPTIVASLFLITIVLIGTIPLYIATVAVLILIFLTQSTADMVKNVQFVAPPLAAAIILAVFSMINIPYLPQNPLYDKAQAFPRELQAPFIESWKVSASSFRDSPFWGSGPSTYPFDFTLYKPLEYNNSKLWNIRFDSAFNEYFQILATLGATGVLALTLFTIIALSQAYKVLINPGQDKQLALSSFAFFIFLSLHPSTLVTWVMGLLILTLLFVITKKIGEYNLSIINSSDSYAQAFDALPGVILMSAILLSMFAAFFVGKFTLADYYHRTALNAIARNQGLQAREALINAVNLNNYSDRYRIDLAQTSFALANAIAASKGPTESSPSSSLTDQDKQNIQILLSESIDHGKAAVTISGQNTANWEVMASIYRQISGVAQNALAFSLDAYGRSIQRDPLNPILRLNVGGVYYTVKNYDLAVRFFTDSINLKPDFANGYYNLAVALRDKGDLPTARLVAQRALELVKKDSNDFDIAKRLVSELNSNAQGEATSSSQPTTAKVDSALADDKKKLPKVLNLPKIEKVTTPSAIKKPNTTPEPSPAP